MKCPCESAGNPRTHGVMCHYAGMISGTPCSSSMFGADSAPGEATRIYHDRRLCVAVCEAHYAWRLTTSMGLGHSKTCPEYKL